MPDGYFFHGTMACPKNTKKPHCCTASSAARCLEQLLNSPPERRSIRGTAKKIAGHQIHQVFSKERAHNTKNGVLPCGFVSAQFSSESLDFAPSYYWTRLIKFGSCDTDTQYFSVELQRLRNSVFLEQALACQQSR